MDKIPSAKRKMDKFSVLGDAIIVYIKQLQERVKALEEEQEGAYTESVVVVEKKSEPSIEDDGNSGETSGENSPEIDVIVCDNSVLVKIRCEKRKGILVKIISATENMNLAVANTSVTPFGNLDHDITIIAEMEEEFKMTVEDIVKGLRSALQAP